MRAKEFTRETIAPIDKLIAQTGRPSGPANIDQTIAATPAKPKTPYNQSALGTGIGKIGQGLSSLAKNPLGKFGRRFAYGMSQGVKDSDALSNATKRLNPRDIAAYLQQNSRGQKLTVTGNTEVDNILKAQGLL